MCKSLGAFWDQWEQETEELTQDIVEMKAAIVAKAKADAKTLEDRDIGGAKDVDRG